MLDLVPNRTPSSTPAVQLDGSSLSIEEVYEIALGRRHAVLSSNGKQQLEKSLKAVEQIVERGDIVYGVTTGFGKFQDTLISKEDRQELQRNLVLSHSAGVGRPFDTAIVRAAMVLSANALTKGFSGVRVKLVELLLECINKGVHPIVPEQGSLGASGDLAPLAHIALVLIGEGSAEYRGEVLPSASALSKAALKPIVLESKEGLALLNGTHFMGALGALLYLQLDNLAVLADIIGTMSLIALHGSSQPFESQLHALRPHPGQIASAANIHFLLQKSSLANSSPQKGKTQDAYSLRCMPQVHGASRQCFQHLRDVLQIEINSVTDNPLVFSDKVLSGGNFHGQPLAFVLDYAAMATSELANISERRIERMVNPALSNGLPAFLINNGGLHSGLMLAQYTAAALVSENKSLAHPASVDSIPSSANQEDHVSMGTIAGRKALAIAQNTAKVLSIELLCAAQALDLRLASEKLQPGPGISAAHKLIRENIKFLDKDRELYLDFALAETVLATGKLRQAVENAVGKPLL